MIRLLLLFIFIVCLWSCDNSSSEHITYNEYVLQNPIVSHGEELNSSFAFVYPSEMVIHDSLIIVNSFQGHDKVLHFFNKTTGNHIISAGHRGRGPGEVIRSKSMSIDRQTGVVYLLDISAKKIVSYDIKKIINGENNFYSDNKLSNIETSFIVEDLQKTGTTLLFKGRGNNTQFAKSKDGVFNVLHDTYPMVTQDKEENQAVWSFEARWKIKPDGSKMVMGTYIGALLQIKGLNQDNIDSDTLLAFNKPVYKVIEDTKPKWVTHTGETVFGFEDIFVTDSTIYTIRSNPEFNPDNDSIIYLYTFDWDGNRKEVYIFKDWIYCGVADEEARCFYGLAQRGEDYVLMRYTM